MDREAVRWFVIGTIGIVGLIAYMAGYSQVLWLSGAAAAIWIGYEIWDFISDTKEKRKRDRSRHHRNAYIKRHR